VESDALITRACYRSLFWARRI